MDWMITIHSINKNLKKYIYTYIRGEKCVIRLIFTILCELGLTTNSCVQSKFAGKCSKVAWSHKMIIQKKGKVDTKW